MPADAANAAIDLWFGSPGSLRRVGDSANRVYSFVESGTRRYLRLTSSGHRTMAQLEAELDFIAHLHRGGVSAMLPAVSRAGRLIEEIPVHGHSVFACVFHEAEGEPFRYDPTRQHGDHFRLLGRTLGRIHALSRTYVPSGSFQRFGWDEDSLLLQAGDLLPVSERIVRREYEALMERLRDLPRSSQTYGLIHGDLGDTNYRLQADRVNIFDFDDCCRHWFVYDLAIAIYPHGWRRESLHLLDRLLEGYAETMQLNVTPADVTLFCRWRLLYMFLVFARKTGFEQLPAPQAEWFARKRENIARGYTWGTSGGRR